MSYEQMMLDYEIAISDSKELIDKSSSRSEFGRCDTIRKRHKQKIIIESIKLLALEKQIPKKPLEIREKRDFNNELLLKDGYCPCCKHEMSNAYIYCNKCGQRIDWED